MFKAAARTPPCLPAGRLWRGLGGGLWVSGSRFKVSGSSEMGREDNNNY